MNELIWKTDWDADDNYGYVPGAAAPELDRLVRNYDTIKGWLTDWGGMAVMGYADIPAIDMTTVPFADLLNQVEGNLAAIGRYAVPYPDGKAWAALAQAPGFEDINRWESNGQALAAACGGIDSARTMCGAAYCGGA
jgi:hypothetical protein